jgi:hypothetical protein
MLERHYRRALRIHNGIFSAMFRVDRHRQQHSLKVPQLKRTVNWIELSKLTNDPEYQKERDKSRSQDRHQRLESQTTISNTEKQSCRAVSKNAHYLHCHHSRPIDHPKYHESSVSEFTSKVHLECEGHQRIEELSHMRK